MRNILVFVSILLWACSCEDDSLKQLPPATQEGKNTLGCLINGEVFVAERGGYYDSPVGVGVHFPYVLGFNGSGYAGDCEDNRANIYLYVEDSTETVKERIYELTSYKHMQPFNSLGYVNLCKSRYETYGESSGQLHVIKLDTIKKIISGTFWFDAKSEEGEMIEIRDGRFDITYEPTRN